MKDVLKNMFYIGAGAAFLTKEKLEELRTELIEKGKMTQDEGKQFIDDMVKKSEEAKSQLDQQIHDAISAQLKNMDIARGDDISQLRTQIEELKAMIEAKSAEG
jgi:polyhydroxyalkanoate synthesis regulator phasin